MSPTPRRSRIVPDLQHVDTVRLPDGRQLDAGDEASVSLPGRACRTRCRFMFADKAGGLVFTDPRKNASRTVRPDAVGTIHRKAKLR